MRFSDIQGLSETKSRLINGVRSGKVAHAQLFSGPEGAANLPIALAYATYLNCEDPGEEDSCGICNACLKNGKFIHPDLHFVFPVSGTKKVQSKDAISQVFLKEWRKFLTEEPLPNLDKWAAVYGGENKQVNISKEESRQIIRNLTLKAFEGTYKIMLIWLPEFLHSYAANGILKILEEPPENTIFLLVTNNNERLLSTITSRTQLVHIRKFNTDELTRILVGLRNVTEENARRVARISEGNLTQALSLLDGMDSDHHELFVEWMRNCYDTRRTDTLVMMAENFHRSSKYEQRGLLKYGLDMMRECLVALHAPELNHLGDKESSFIINFSKLLQAEQVDIISKDLNNAMFHLERNGSAKMTFLDTSLSIMKTIRP